MYISTDCIKFALDELAPIHPFYGITYLVCKQHSLPIGVAEDFPINFLETTFLNEFYKPLEQTEKYFRVFRPSEKSKYWLNKDYPSSGSQATRTQMFSGAFLYEKHSSDWGWSPNYINILKAHLGNKRIPLFSLAAWILKDKNWSEEPTPEAIKLEFINRFYLTDFEIEYLFDAGNPKWISIISLSSKHRYNWGEIASQKSIPMPPDISPEKGGALKSIELKNLPPYKNFKLEFSERINIVTGDNGLGKSFVLECCWWALTKTWSKFSAHPLLDRISRVPSIRFQISGELGSVDSLTGLYSLKSQDWQIKEKGTGTIPGLVIFAQSDGSYAIWDPTKNDYRDLDTGLSAPMFLSNLQVWEGVRSERSHRTRGLFNGIISDWVNWQTIEPDKFAILKNVLRRLSPPDLSHGDLGTLEPGNIVRIPFESRPMPTIRHPYGEVPIVFASAAVKRIIGLAYLIVWTWTEHNISADLMSEEPQSKMLILADEIENHLHPQWQRLIMPSLVSVASDLSKDLSIEFIVTTHSPLVMASLESIFDPEIDRMFHLNLAESAGTTNVVVDELEFEKRGSADAWLTSNSFELKHAYSIEAEQTLEQAKKLIKAKNPSKTAIRNISNELNEILPPHDKFWIRWNYFAEQNSDLS